jgi:hypothetical protein
MKIQHISTLCRLRKQWSQAAAQGNCPSVGTVFPESWQCLRPGIFQPIFPSGNLKPSVFKLRKEYVSDSPLKRTLSEERGNYTLSGLCDVTANART